jgi:hypothetical protein
MNNYEKGMAILEEKFGGGKDNVISLATIDTKLNEQGKPRPVVRDVDAYYADGTFYSVTYGKSSKMEQIAQNNEVAVAVHFEWFTARGIGENLGWVLDPKNAELRDILRKVFEKWYDMANDESDQNCCFLKISLTKGLINLNHHETLIYMDFVNKAATVEGVEI